MRDLILFLHFSGIVIGAGAGFSLFIIGFLAAHWDAAYRATVAQSLFPLRYVSYAGLTLLVLSGGVLIAPYGPMIHTMPWLMAKLTCVLLLVLLSGSGAYQMRRARLGQAADALKKLSLIGRASVVLSLGIVLCAVMSFH